jgi:hypothetical protein
MPPSYPNRSRHCRQTSNEDAPQILWLVLWRGRRTTMTAAMSARTHTRAEGPRHHRAAGPAGPHAGWKWPRDNDHPFGTSWAARTPHSVVRPEGALTPGDKGAGEEDNRDDENRAGDDYHPRRDLVEPRRLGCVRRRGRRRRAGVRRLELGLGCLGHPLIMPTSAAAIKRRAHGVADPLSAQPNVLPPATHNRGGRLAAQ